MNAIVADTPETVNAFNLLRIKGMLKLESFGMQASRGKSALSMVKAMGIKGRTAKEALPLYEAHLKQLGVLV